MEIFVQHQGQQTGPFSSQQIREGLANGHYQPTDLAWCEGMENWRPLASFPNLQNGPPQLANTQKSDSSGLAITSMVLGISGFLCGITAIPAVICGHIALARSGRTSSANSGRGFAIAGLITGYLGILVFAGAMLAGVAAPMIIRQKHKADQTEAIKNARMIGLFLFEFEAEYGEYPNEETAEYTARDSGAPEITGTSSNARFRQLFQAGITQDENAFYSKGGSLYAPDDNITGDEALAPGECGFAYFENVNTEDGALRPLVITPLIPGTSQFDPSPFGGKAIILWSDNSVSSWRIDPITGIVSVDGSDILLPTHPIWNGNPPNLPLPE